MQERTLEINNIGSIWSSTASGGLGGYGKRVNVGELKLADQHAQQATLTLGLANLNTSKPMGPGRVYAIVTYGIGASNQTVILDWSQGTSICLPVGVLNVGAIEVNFTGAPALEMPVGFAPPSFHPIVAQFSLTASLSAGPRCSLGMPTLTQSFSLEAGDSFDWPVPTRAKRVLVGERRTVTTTDLLVSVNGPQCINAYDLADPSDSFVRTNGVSLPGLSDSVTISSASGAKFITLCWFLDG